MDHSGMIPISDVKANFAEWWWWNKARFLRAGLSLQKQTCCAIGLFISNLVDKRKFIVSSLFKFLSRLNPLLGAGDKHYDLHSLVPAASFFQLYSLFSYSTATRQDNPFIIKRYYFGWLYSDWNDQTLRVEKAWNRILWNMLTLLPKYLGSIKLIKDNRIIQ